MKFKLIRCASMVLAVACVFLLACPAFAEGINYRDYETRVDVDGDNDLVTISIPVDWCEGALVYGTGTLFRQWHGSTFSWDFTDSVMEYDKLRVYIAPFGTAFAGWEYDYADGRYLSTNNIPSGATFKVDFAIKLESSDGDISFKSSDFRSYSVDNSYASFITSSRQSPNPTIDSNNWLNFSFEGDIPTDSDGWFPFMNVYMNGQTSGGIFYFELRSFEIQLSINALYRLNETTQENNALLREVERQLEEQGKTMNDILNGTPEQNEAADDAAGILGNKGDQLGGLVDDIQTEKPNLDSVDVDKIIPSAGINTLSGAISPIAENPLVIKILVMVGTLLLVSYVLFGKKG